MEMIRADQILTVPLWQLLAFLGALTVCALFRKSIGMVIFSFLFAAHWVFWQKARLKVTEGQEYTLLAVFFVLALVCAFAVAWHMYKADHYE